MNTLIPQLCLISLLVINSSKMAAPSETSNINWLSFEELEAKLDQEPKKVLIYFTTTWCTYCRKMDKEVFTNPALIDLMKNKYFSVKFDAESEEEVTFDGVTFRNLQTKSSRKGIHELALLLGRNQGQFAPPTFVILNENFEVTTRHFEYLHSARLIEILEK